MSKKNKAAQPGTTPNTLDLDKIFVEAPPLKVLYKGTHYPMKRIEQLGPRDAVPMDDLRKRARHLEHLGSNLNPKQSDELSGLVDRMLTLLAPTLPIKAMPFLAKSRVLTWYMQQVAPDRAEALLGKAQ